MPKVPIFLEAEGHQAMVQGWSKKQLFFLPDTLWLSKKDSFLSRPFSLRPWEDIGYLRTKPFPVLYSEACGSSVYLFIQLIPTGYLLDAKHWGRHWGHSSEQGQCPFPRLYYGSMGRRERVKICWWISVLSLPAPDAQWLARPSSDVIIKSSWDPPHRYLI